MKRRNDRGSALLIAMIIIVVSLALVGAVLTVSLRTTEANQNTYEVRRALYVAEAGLNAAIVEMNAVLASLQSQLQQTFPQTITVTPAEFDGGSYSVSATLLDPSQGVYHLTAVGTFNDERRTLEAVVAPGIPVAFNAAITVFGPLATDYEFNVRNDVSGSPRVYGGSRPAVAVEGDQYYQETMDQLVALVPDPVVAVGGASDTFQGSGHVGWPDDSDPDAIQLPVVSKPDVQFGAAFWEKVRSSLIDHTEVLISQNSFDTTYTSDQTISGDVVLGSPSSPVSVYIDADLEIPHGSSLTIYGDIILTDSDIEVWGGLNVHDGHLTILGGHGEDGEDAVLDVRRGGKVNLNRTDVFILGHNGGQARIRQDNHEDKTTGTWGTEYVQSGSIYALGGQGDDRSEIEFQMGRTDITGLIIAEGDADVELEFEEHSGLHPERNNGGTIGENADTFQFRHRGAVAVGVTGTDSRTEIELDGDVIVQYDETVVETQLNNLEKWISQNLGAGFTDKFRLRAIRIEP